MPRDRKWTLELDSANPRDNGCWDKDGNMCGAISPANLNEWLNNGTLTPIGVTYSGKFNAATLEAVSSSQAATIQTVNCIVITVGGTAYKICS